MVLARESTDTCIPLHNECIAQAALCPHPIPGRGRLLLPHTVYMVDLAGILSAEAFCASAPSKGIAGGCFLGFWHNTFNEAYINEAEIPPKAENWMAPCDTSRHSASCFLSLFQTGISTQVRVAFGSGHTVLQTPVVT